MPRRAQTPARTREPSGGRDAAALRTRWLVLALVALAPEVGAQRKWAPFGQRTGFTLEARVCCEASQNQVYVIWKHGKGKEAIKFKDTLVEDLQSTLTYNFLPTPLSNLSVVLRFNESIYTSSAIKYGTSPRVQDQVPDENTTQQEISTTKSPDAIRCELSLLMQNEEEIYSSTCGGSHRQFEVTFINGNDSQCWGVPATDSSSGHSLCSMVVRVNLGYNARSQPSTDREIVTQCSNEEENCFNVTLPHASTQKVLEVRVFKMTDGSWPPHGRAWIVFVVVLVLLGLVLGFVLRQKWRRRTQDPIVGERWSPPRRAGDPDGDWSPTLRPVSALSSSRCSTTPFFEWDLDDRIRTDAPSPVRSRRQLHTTEEEVEGQDMEGIFSIPFRTARGQRLPPGAVRLSCIPPPLPPRRNASRVSPPPPPLPPRPLTPRRHPVPAPKTHAFSTP